MHVRIDREHALCVRRFSRDPLIDFLLPVPHDTTLSCHRSRLGSARDFYTTRVLFEPRVDPFRFQAYCTTSADARMAQFVTGSPFRARPSTARSAVMDCFGCRTTVMVATVPRDPLHHTQVGESQTKNTRPGYRSLGTLQSRPIMYSHGTFPRPTTACPTRV
jgi:hypothetical protein